MSDLPPPPNPVLNAYTTFAKETPFVSKFMLISQGVTWVLSFFVDLSFAFANIPHFTIFKLELYRLILSPFICLDLLSLVFAYFSVIGYGRRVEFKMGSMAYACLIASIGLGSSTFHIVLAFLLYAVTGSQVWLFSPSSGIWTFLFGIVAMECSQAPPNSTRRLFMFEVPMRYYPVALLLLLSFFGGFRLSNLGSVGIGYAIGHGRLEFLRIEESRFRQWEASFLESCVRLEGWVSCEESGDISRDEELGAGPTGGFLSNASSVGQTGHDREENSESGQPRPGRAITSKSATSAEPSFPAGGRQLGSASRRANTGGSTNPRQARLEAIERRIGGTKEEDAV